ncbi:hypothetical protein KPH14_010931 [Odynerus spinipes]|uniref:Uncharacterized protein n=1 Tax=Odynerus spinipes TaxID=1348599 RepID=A0AAD9RG56_9HYME|nr:hypothetical protein KPH14_010931 [Odynerus spinipes]
MSDSSESKNSSDSDRDMVTKLCKFCSGRKKPVVKNTSGCALCHHPSCSKLTNVLIHKEFESPCRSCVSISPPLSQAPPHPPLMFCALCIHQLLTNLRHLKRKIKSEKLDVPPLSLLLKLCCCEAKNSKLNNVSNCLSSRLERLEKLGSKSRTQFLGCRSFPVKTSVQSSS